MYKMKWKEMRRRFVVFVYSSSSSSSRCLSLREEVKPSVFLFHLFCRLSVLKLWYHLSFLLACFLFPCQFLDALFCVMLAASRGCANQAQAVFT